MYCYKCKEVELPEGRRVCDTCKALKEQSKYYDLRPRITKNTPGAVLCIECKTTWTLNYFKMCDRCIEHKLDEFDYNMHKGYRVAKQPIFR